MLEPMYVGYNSAVTSRCSLVDRYKSPTDLGGKGKRGTSPLDVSWPQPLPSLVVATPTSMEASPPHRRVP